MRGSASTPQKLNNGEAVMGFLCWLSTRQETATFGFSEECAIAGELWRRFKDANDLDDIRENWTNALHHPEDNYDED